MATHDNMTIREAQQAVDDWIKQYGVRYFSELTNMACLTEEVGELARVMARRYGDQSFKEGESHDPSEEMADILWVLICLANQTGVDLTEELQKSLEKKTQRDHDQGVADEPANLEGNLTAIKTVKGGASTVEAANGELNFQRVSPFHPSHNLHDRQS